MIEQDAVVELVDRPTEKGRLITCSVVNLFLVGSVVSALLATIIPNFKRAQAQGNLTECKTNLRNIGTAFEMYSTDWSGKYPSKIETLVPIYLDKVPRCPSAGSVTYQVYTGLGPNNNPGFQDYYYLECRGLNHQDTSTSENHPAHDSLSTCWIERP